MRTKKQVCFRTSSAIADRLGLPKGVPGEVMCSYRVIREGANAPARLDVRFGRRIAWGVLEKEFEIVPFSAHPIAEQQAAPQEAPASAERV